LVVEDEENLLQVLRYNLEREGYRVHTAVDGEEGLEAARIFLPDLIVLDIMLPKLDGLEVCRILRQESDVPVLMLTAKGEEIDRIVGLELGADDYVAKPFSVRELMARVKAILRRSHSSSGSPTGDTEKRHLKSGDIEMDLVRHTVRVGGTEANLRPREFDLLALFMENKGRALTREQILGRLWGHDYYGDTRTVDVHVR